MPDTYRLTPLQVLRDNLVGQTVQPMNQPGTITQVDQTRGALLVTLSDGRQLKWYLDEEMTFLVAEENL